MNGGPAHVPPIPPPGWLSELLQRVAEALRRVRDALTPFGTGGPGAPGSATNPLTEAQAIALFNEFSGMVERIPFDYPPNGCFARAHAMCRLMQDKGIECGKAWNYASSESDPVNGRGLAVTTADGTVITWRYHVAPTVMVQGADGVVRPTVIDPSVTDRPITAQAWAALQSDPNATLELTDADPYYRDLGEQPGTDGNWGWEDPHGTQMEQDLQDFRNLRDAAKGGSAP